MKLIGKGCPLKASDGRVVLSLYTRERASGIVTPESAQLEEFPQFVVEDVGPGRVSPHNGEREQIPFAADDRVIVAESRCCKVKIENTLYFVVDWTAIFAKVCA